MRKPTWVPGLKWVWKTSDRIDIWAQETFKLNPKQRALELAMDLNPNKRINKAIDEALGLTTTKPKQHKKKTKRHKASV